MDPEGAVSGSVNIETKKAADEGNRKIGLDGSTTAPRYVRLGQRFGETKNSACAPANCATATPRHGYSEDNKEFALNADYRGENCRGFDSIQNANQRRSRAYEDIQNANGPLV